MKTLTHYIANILLTTTAACAVLVAGVVWQQTRVAQASSVLTSLPTTGLVGYWSFDTPTINWGTGQVKDLSTSTNTGFITGIATTTSPNPGVFGQAFSFDGSTSYVDGGASSTLKPRGNITVCAWVKPNNTANAAYVDHGNEGTGYVLGQGIGATGAGVASFYLNNGSSWFFASTSVSTGVWTFFCGERNGVNISIYKNGLLGMTAASAFTGLVSYTTVTNLTLGSDSTGASHTYKLNGSLDEVRIYNRALSVAEINNLYKLSPKAATFGQANTVSLSNGLIGYWPLDGNTINWRTGSTTDASGNGNFGSLNSGFSTSTSPVPGKIGGALYFNGASMFKTQASTLWNLNDLTTSAWVYITAGQNTGYNRIISRDNFGEQGTRYTFVLREAYAGATDKPQFATYDSIFAPVASSPTALTTGWHFLAGVRVTHSTIKLYVDGVMVASNVDSTTGPLGTIASNVALGSLSNGSTTLNEVFKGVIDDARVYNRALSANEITALYNLGKVNIAHSNTVALSNGLVGYWPLDGSTTFWKTGSTTDVSGNGNFGSLITFSTTTSPVPGKIGGAFNFNGVTQKVAISDSTSNQVVNFTISAWVKPSSLPGTINGIFVKGNYAAGPNSFGLTMRSGKLAGLTGDTVGYTENVGAGTTLSVGVWQHAVLTYDGARLVAYLNGVQQWSVVDTRVLSTVGQSVAIGNGGGVSSFSGAIDDVRLYNRALSATEVAQLYAQSK